jgi:F0F1-type ATP synthase assembly protein I
MLRILAVLLLVLWSVGLVTSYTMGGFIHVLPAIAIAAVLIHVLQARKAAQRPWRTFRGRAVARR